MLVKLSGGETRGRIHQNAEEALDPSPCSVIFHLLEWETDFHTFATKSIFGKPATSSLFNEPTRKMPWNGHPIYSFLLNIEKILIFPSANYQHAFQLIESCNGNVTMDIKNCDCGLIAGPVRNAEEWVGLCSISNLKGRSWLKRLESFRSGSKKFESWKLFGKAKVIEGLACHLVAQSFDAELIRMLIRNGATVEKTMMENIVVFFSEDIEFTLEDCKTASSLHCSLVKSDWVIKTLEIGKPVAFSKYYHSEVKGSSSCLSLVTISKGVSLFISESDILCSNELEELKEMGFQTTINLNNADLIVTNVNISAENIDPRMVTKFCIVS